MGNTCSSVLLLIFLLAVVYGLYLGSSLLTFLIPHPVNSSHNSLAVFIYPLYFLSFGPGTTLIYPAANSPSKIVLLSSASLLLISLSCYFYSKLFLLRVLSTISYLRFFSYTFLSVAFKLVILKA